MAATGLVVGALVASTLAGCAALPLAWSAVDAPTASGSAPGATASAAAAGWTCHTLQATGDGGGDPAPADLSVARSVVQRRLALLGQVEATVDALPPDALLVGLPPGDQVETLEAITRTGALMLVAVPPEFDQLVVDGEPAPDGMPLEVIVDESGVIEAGLIVDAMGQPAVRLDLDAAAAAAFDAFAADNLGRRVAIVVDGIVRSAPVIQAPAFGGEVHVSGGFSEAEARALVAGLGGGRLPVRLVPVAERAMAGVRCAE